MLNLGILAGQCLGKTDHQHPSLEHNMSIHITSQRLNAALGTVTGNNTSVFLNHGPPFGQSGQIRPFS